MTLRKGHGKGADSPRVEVLPADELPEPVPGQPAPVKRRADGTIADGATARLLGARGGKMRHHRARLVSALGLVELTSDSAFAPYRNAGDEFVREHLATLALQAGGIVGPGPSSIVASAGLQLAASRFLADKGAQTGDAALLVRASTLANDSRQNLLAAYELAVKEAKGRQQAAPASPWLEGEQS